MRQGGDRGFETLDVTLRWAHGAGDAATPAVRDAALLPFLHSALAARQSALAPRHLALAARQSALARHSALAPRNCTFDNMFCTRHCTVHSVSCIGQAQLGSTREQEMSSICAVPGQNTKAVNEQYMCSTRAEHESSK